MQNGSSRPRRGTARLEREVPPRSRILRIVKWGALLALVGAALGAVTVAAVFWMYGRDDQLPNIRTLDDYKPKQVTVILDGEGYRVGEIYKERRTVVDLKKIPRFVVDSFVAAEDDNFWKHGGIDYVGMVRAFFANVKAGRSKQGASTITQQVVKNLVLSPEKTFKRKLQEIILARRLESSLTKEQILTLYLNEIYLGHGRYGVQEASLFYFGKGVDALDVGEAAMLAGLPQSPERLSPLKNPVEAKARQTYVLNRLAVLGKLTPDEAKKWIDKPITLAKSPFPRLGSAPEWIDLVKKELVAKKGEAGLDTMGAVVKTTLDVKLQAAAQAALQKGLRAYDERHKVARPFRSFKGDKIDAEIARLKKRMPRTGPSTTEISDAVVLEVHDGGAGGDGSLEVDLGGWKATVPVPGDDDRANPVGKDGKRKKPSERFARGDEIEVFATADKPQSPDKADEHVAHLAPGPEGAVVAIKLPSREVAALVGGYASKAAGFNRATMAHRQPGSSFKPYLYATAIDSGRFTAATLVNDAPDVYDLYKPQNYAKDTFEGAVRLRYALSKSINTVAIRMCSDVGPDTVAALAARAGIASPLPKELSLALGSGEVTPIEHVNAIGTFATGGLYAPPRFIATIDGEAAPGVPPVQAIRPEVAYVTTDMMRSVVTEGTAQAANKLGIPVAGKTGTSNDARDVWFVAITPDWAIGVWMGYDDNRSLGKRETGGVAAVPVFVDLARTMNLPAKKFPRPASIVEARIDKATGKLAADGSPEGTYLQEVFIAGSAPTEIAPLPGEVDESTFVTDEYGDEMPAEEPSPAAKPE